MTNQPNVLIIHADQHRCDCLGAYGNAGIRTPHIDALARDGVRYDQHFCAFPVCTPSRYSLLSGLYVHQHLGWTNHCTLPPGLPTFPRVLRDSGYSTAAVGKMHFTPTYMETGFQQMVLAEQNGPGRYDDDYHRYLRERDLCDGVDLTDQEQEYRRSAPPEYWNHLGAVVSDLDEEHHSTTWIADRAMDMLDGWTPGGNLLLAGFIKPHHPFDPPAPWHSMYRPEGLQLLPGWTDACSPDDLAWSPGYFANAEIDVSQLKRAMAYYYASISQIDHHVGRMVQLLRARGLYDDTLIVYTSDHGDYMGYHHLLLKGNRMYDPLMRIPLIIKYPGREQAGETRGELCSNVDVAPTLLRHTGCSVPETMSGLDLRNMGAGRDAVFAESGRGREYMARTRRHKLLYTPDGDQTRLFDLELDPLELNDRSAEPEYLDERQALEQRLARWSLFDAPGAIHLDECGPTCEGANAVRHGDTGRHEREQYFRSRMRGALEA
jgi:arylsulfatase